MGTRFQFYHTSRFTFFQIHDALLLQLHGRVAREGDGRYAGRGHRRPPRQEHVAPAAVHARAVKTITARRARTASLGTNIAFVSWFAGRSFSPSLTLAKIVFTFRPLMQDLEMPREARQSDGNHRFGRGFTQSQCSFN